ncbi:hypothetical protein FQA39_LY06016 [Lamprigera yunnana]|nr:hypothetical protein FQA39_LY06016 [Lamprigera yunnana]
MYAYLIFILIGQSLATASNKSLLPDKSVCGLQNVGVDSSSGAQTSAKEKEFPWVVLLKYEGSNPFKCLGTLISEKYVLTSAVCIKSKNQFLYVFLIILSGTNRYNFRQSVILGTHELGKLDHTVEYGVEEQIAHEDYKRGKKQYDHDIGLLRLNATVKFTDYIKPICLPSDTTKLTKPDDVVTLTGWGRDVSGESIVTKKVIRRRIIENSECQTAYNKYNISITDYHVCTHTLKDDKAYACAGDGGGPIMFSNEHQWHQEGIISFGSACGHDFPDVNTKVIKYVPWILGKLRE